MLLTARPALQHLGGIAYRFLAGALLAFDGILLFAVVRAGWAGYRLPATAVVAVTGLLMLGLSAYLLLRAPGERAARGLVAVMLFGFPAVVFVATEHLPGLFYHAGLAGLFVRLADAGGPRADQLLSFMLNEGDFYLSLLAPAALLYLAVVFPRPLTPRDIAPERTVTGGMAWLRRPVRRGLARLQRLLLRHRWALLAVGLFPPVAHVLEGQPHPDVCSAGAAVLLLFALAFFQDGYAVSGPADRRRVLWVMGGLFVAGLSMTLWVLARGIALEITPAPVLEGIRWLTLLAGPVAFGLVAAGVLYQGAFDPTLMVRRTTVYGGLGVLLTMVFAAVEEVTTERMFGEAGLPDTVGAALAAALVLAIYRPLRSRIGSLYDGFLDRDPPASADDAPTLLAVRVPDADDALSGTLLERCARAAATERGGGLAEADHGVVILELPDPSRALAACRDMEDRLATAAAAVDAPAPALACAAFRIAVGTPADPEFARREALDAVRHMVDAAGPAELVMPRELAAEPTVVRAGRLEPAPSSSDGPIGRFRLAPESSPGSRRLAGAVLPVLAGAAAALLIPVLLSGERTTPTLQSATSDVPTFPGDSVFDRGEDLTGREIRVLEARVAEVPGDVAARGLLLRYWCQFEPMTIPRWHAHEHALWILEQRPTHPVAFEAALCVPESGPVRRRAYALVVQHASAPDAPPRALALAGLLLRVSAEDQRPELAAELFDRASAEAPDDPVIRAASREHR